MSVDPAALAHPLEFPTEFKQWLVDYVALNVPKLPVGQVFGFDLEKVKTATVDASDTRSATSYGDLTNVGPTLSNLANGWYLLFFGCDMAISTTDTQGGYMSPSINGAAAQDADACSILDLFNGGIGTSAFRALLVNLTSNDLNSIVMKYRSSSSARTITFGMRFLHAFKVLNLDA